jgi:hypothetical protein
MEDFTKITLKDAELILEARALRAAEEQKILDALSYVERQERLKELEGRYAAIKAAKEAERVAKAITKQAIADALEQDRKAIKEAKQIAREKGREVRRELRCASLALIEKEKIAAREASRRYHEKNKADVLYRKMRATQERIRRAEAAEKAAASGVPPAPRGRPRKYATEEEALLARRDSMRARRASLKTPPDAL